MVIHKPDISLVFFYDVLDLLRDAMRLMSFSPRLSQENRLPGEPRSSAEQGLERYTGAPPGHRICKASFLKKVS